MGWKQLRYGAGVGREQRKVDPLYLTPARKRSSEPPRNRHPTRTRSLPAIDRWWTFSVRQDLIVIFGLLVVAILFYAEVKFGCASGVEPASASP